MKVLKSIVGLSILLIASLIFTNCQNENEENNLVQENRLKASDFEFVGKEHNKVLEKAFSILKKEKEDILKKEKNNELQRILIKAISETEEYSKSSKDEGIESIKRFFNKKEYDFNYEGLPISENFSKEIIKNYLLELNEVITNIDINESEEFIKNKISIFEESISEDKELNQYELMILYSSTQTAKNSLIYWKNNLMDWIEISDNKKFKTSRGGCPTNCPIQQENAEHLAEIAQDDVAGAVAGAVGAAVANAVPVGGQVAYGTAIVSTAVGRSAYTAAKKLINWLWD